VRYDPVVSSIPTTARHLLAAAAFGLMTAAGCATSATPQAPVVPAPRVATAKEIVGNLKQWDAASSESRRAAAEDVAHRTPDFALLRLETFSCGGQTHEVAMFSHAKTGLEFALVPGGGFEMGAHELPAEEPVHRVTVGPLLLARTECTQAAWDRVGGDDARKWRDGTLPIEGANWTDCTTWCGKAGLRLPSEAEWEHGCRAGTTTKWNCGDDEGALLGVAWIFLNSGATTLPAETKWNFDKAWGEWGCRTHSVGGKPPNAFGLFDMHGNVWEWCEDSWHDNYKGAPTDGSAWAEANPSLRVIRDGGWLATALSATSAFRGGFVPVQRSPFVGFRPVKSVAME
jgi:formylglycine-generating enzyme required for sulfatase activity